MGPQGALRIGRVLRGRNVLHLALAACIAFAAVGCDDSDAEKKPKPADAGPPDAAPPPDVPASPTDLMATLPAPPPPAVARPGDPATAVTEGHPEIKPSTISPKILQGHYPEGPFPLVTYLIGADKRVRSVIMRLGPAYSHPFRKAALFDAVRGKLQEGKALDHPRYTGERWPELHHRVELRQDNESEQMELVFHIEGARPLPGQ